MNIELFELGCFITWAMFWATLCFCGCCIGVSFVIHSYVDAKTPKRSK